MTHTAFFYGTLMAPPVLHRVIWGPAAHTSPPAHASPLHIRPAILHGHARHRVQHADYPAVVPATSTTPPSCVRGMLVAGLTDGDVWRLDVFEGREYKRRKVRVRVLGRRGREQKQGVEVEGGDGGRRRRRRSSSTTTAVEDEEEEEEAEEEIEAETYLWIADPQRLQPQEWDFDEFVREKMGRWAGWDGVGVGDAAGEVDEGFRDVDDAVAATTMTTTTTTTAHQDPTGGRGANGFITRQLQGQNDVQEQTSLGDAV